MNDRGGGKGRDKPASHHTLLGTFRGRIVCNWLNGSLAKNPNRIEFDTLYPHWVCRRTSSDERGTHFTYCAFIL